MKSFTEEFAEIKRLCESSEFQNEIEITKKYLSNKPLVLYGAGTVGSFAVSVLKQYGISVTCFCDKNKSGMQKETGLPIISPQTLKNDYQGANILICSVNYAEEIRSDLKTLGIASDRIFTKEFLNLHEMTYNDIEPHLSGYERTYNLLNDDKSREVLLGRLKCYLISCPFILPPPPPPQFFDHEIIKLNDHEVFVDCGMCTGGTAEQFFMQVNNKYSHYYGFEPDADCYKAAIKNLAGKPNITIVNKGLWGCEKRLSFIGGLTGTSKFDETGSDNLVDVTTLDLFFSAKEPPTFITMDIEGAELEALIGAEQVIHNYKPKLGISVYHKLEDVYVLPELIKSYRDDYKFYLRHYSNSIYETVLYAV